MIKNNIRLCLYSCYTSLFVMQAAVAQPTIKSDLASRSFSTQNYHLFFRIPPQTFRCHVPSSFVGSDHGVEIYLSKPTACDPQAGVALDPEALPHIDIFYAYNVAEIKTPHGDSRPPKNNSELASQSCVPGAPELPKEMILFKQPATGCLTHTGRIVDVRAVSLYSQYEQSKLGAADSLLEVSLHTTEDRLDKDLGLMRGNMEGIAICSHKDLPRVHISCPPMKYW